MKQAALYRKTSPKFGPVRNSTTRNRLGIRTTGIGHSDAALSSCLAPVWPRGRWWGWSATASTACCPDTVFRNLCPAPRIKRQDAASTLLQPLKITEAIIVAQQMEPA